MDELEGIALRADLLTAADSVGLAVQRDVTLSDGLAFVPGAGALGVAADWALDPVTDIGEVSQFFENATGFHLFELLGRSQQGVAPVTDVAVNIRQILSVQKKKLLAREAAAGVVTAVAAGTPLDEAAARFGWTVEETGMFRRGDFVPGLGQGTEAIGEAFGAPLGATTGVVDAGDGVAVLQVLDRVDATREGFEEVKEAVLSQLEFERTQQYVDKWLASLRAEAVVEDHRARLNNPDADAS
jgi:peptidyl-prolyl cis-trans isomerase D